MRDVHLLLTAYQPQRNRLEVRLVVGGKPYGGCPGGDMLWLGTRVIVLGDDRDIDFLFPAVKAPESNFKFAFRCFFFMAACAWFSALRHRGSTRPSDQHAPRVEPVLSRVVRAAHLMSGHARPTDYRGG